MTDSETSLLFDALMVIVAAIAAGVAVWAKLDSSTSAKASQTSAEAAKESNYIAAQNLETYRDEILYLRQKCVSVHINLEVFYPRKLTSPFAAGPSPFEPQNPKPSDPVTQSSGIVVVANLRNMGVRVEVQRIWMIMSKQESPLGFPAILPEPIHLDRGSTAKAYFPIDLKFVEAALANPTSVFSFVFETTPIDGEVECKPFEVDLRASNELIGGIELWNDSLGNFEPLRHYNTTHHAKVGIMEYMRNVIGMWPRR